MLDEDVNPAVATVGRGLGLDVVSVHEMDRRGVDDPSQLELAAATGRVFVTRNRDDYIKLTVRFYQMGAPHPGIIVIPYTLPNREPGRIARALKTWHDEHTVDESLQYAIFFLEER
ncbi:MAG TPA: DUF5615 family PIN-like protein [Vicinamibacteria bacterium]|nr:DUF5615 family PIN-like protein [Vicinamibacteria bacterium]